MVIRLVRVQECAWLGSVFFVGSSWVACPSGDITFLYGMVGGMQHIALPFHFKHILHYSAFVASTCNYWPPTRLWPSYNLRFRLIKIINYACIAFYGFRCGTHDSCSVYFQRSILQHGSLFSVQIYWF